MLTDLACSRHLKNGAFRVPALIATGCQLKFFPQKYFAHHRAIYNLVGRSFYEYLAVVNHLGAVDDRKRLVDIVL
jgi:hypothetical protein